MYELSIKKVFAGLPPAFTDKPVPAFTFALATSPTHEIPAGGE